MLVLIVVVVTVGAVIVVVVVTVLFVVNDEVLVGKVVVTKGNFCQRESRRHESLIWSNLPVVDGVVVDDWLIVTVFPAERVIVNHMRVMVTLVLVVDGVAVIVTV